MADFLPAFEKMIRNEGGYKLTNVSSDRGGQTYAGIARNFFPNWPGWRYIDQKQLDSAPLTALVRDFYKHEFWDRLSGDKIRQQAIAASIFDFGVNAGARTAAKLAQLVVGVTPDGGIGEKSLTALNATDADLFVLKFAIAKVTRYAEICNRDRTQSKFLLGWINRTIEGLS